MVLILANLNRINTPTLNPERKIMFIEVFRVFVTSVIMGLFQILKLIIVLPVTISLLISFWVITCYEKITDRKERKNENN